MPKDGCRRFRCWVSIVRSHPCCSRRAARTPYEGNIDGTIHGVCFPGVPLPIEEAASFRPECSRRDVGDGGRAGHRIRIDSVISRLFFPADFGIFGSFSAVLGVITAGVTLEYTQAIMLPKEKGDALCLFYISCLCTIVVSLLCLAVCLLIAESLHEMMKTEGAWMLAMLILATLATGLNSSCQAWCIRVKAFKETSASQVIRSLS